MMAAAIYRKLLGILALAVAAAACGGGTTTTTSGGQPTQQKAATRVEQASSPVGDILTDGSGRTLYIFTEDSKGKTSCYGECAQNWPPLVVRGKPQAGSQINASMLGTTERKNGDKQVTYGNMPLYYYASDTSPEDVTGQAVEGEWWVVSPAGMPIKKQPPSDSGSGYGGGY